MPIAMDFNFKNYFLTLLIRSFKEALTDSGGQIMAKDKEIKTNAMRFLDKNKIKYEKFIYDCDEFIDGTDVARKLGQPFERTFKTLVSRKCVMVYICSAKGVARLEGVALLEQVCHCGCGL